MTERMTAIVGARISEFRRKMAEVNAIAKKVPNRIVVRVVENFKQTQRRLDRLATSIRTISEISGNMLGGTLLMVSPAAVPILAGLAASLMMLGPMLGTIAGSSFALLTAFGAAGAGALAFGSMAIPTITKIFDENAELNKQQKEARKSWEKLGKTWKGIMKELETPILNAFTKAMEIANKVVKMAKPLFESSAKAVNNLLDALKTSLNSAPIQAFFDFMNKNAGPLLETIGKAAGNFIQGFMSMMVAFGPLAKDTAGGFLDMSKRFAEWADNLKNSKGFKNFVKYIQDNMPKIRGIFRDAIAGLVYFFAAFGPLASDMMSGLQDMMGSFKEWAKGLKDNPAFQNFIQYIRDNGPMVLDFIGQLTTFISNLVVGMAPLGTKLLEIVTWFLELTNTLMENHPWLQKVLGWSLVIVGALKLLVGPLILLAPLFIGLGKAIATASVWVFKIGRFLLGLGNPIGLVITLVTTLALIVISKWDMIKNTTKVVFTAIGNVISTVFGEVKRIVKSGMDTVKRNIDRAWQYIKDTFSNALKFVKGLLKGDFKAMWGAVKDQMNNIKDTVSDIWGNIKEHFANIDLKESGKKIIQSAIDGIVAMKDKVISNVKSIAQSIRDFFPFSPAKTGPLSTLHKLDFAGPVKDSLARGKKSIQGAMADMLTIPDIGMNPALAGGYDVNVKTNTPNKYETRSQKEEFASAVSVALEDMVLDNRIVIGESEIIQATGKPMMRFIEKETHKAGRKRGNVR